MPTFFDPAADADEAYQAMRALAHQTAAIDDPRQIYPMLGSLSAAVAALGQTLHQIARFHDTDEHHRVPRTDARRSEVGARHEVSWELHRAGEIMNHVAACIDRAHEVEGTIVHEPPTPAAAPPPPNPVPRPGLGL